MKIVILHDKAYVIDFELNPSDIKNEDKLSRLTWIYGSDTLIKSKNGNLLLLASEIKDATIIEDVDETT